MHSYFEETAKLNIAKQINVCTQNSSRAYIVKLSQCRRQLSPSYIPMLLRNIVELLSIFLCFSLGFQKRYVQFLYQYILIPNFIVCIFFNFIIYLHKKFILYPSVEEYNFTFSEGTNQPLKESGKICFIDINVVNSKQVQNKRHHFILFRRVAIEGRDNSNLGVVINSR